jgi:5-hydroxyisourate hydrolase-like protein (transthyretin family)
VAVRADPAGEWRAHAAARTDADGRCAGLPALPDGTTHARLSFAVEPYLARDRADGGADRAFFPEVTVVPLLLTPFGYSVYRGS